jgi:signal transduction histidine kinase
LGLSISYEIIQRHHGEIQVESQEGIGTTFMIQLPIVKHGELF